MARERKPGGRREALLDAGELLFIQKGYEQTTVNDILEYVDIGKGTFYHYFQSKDALMDAVIMRVVAEYAAAARAVADAPGLDAHEKFARILLGEDGKRARRERMLPELHKVENARMHQKSIVESILALAPILADVIRQGVEEGTFQTPYPQETVEILLTADQFLFDPAIFSWEPPARLQKTKALLHTMEVLLGAAPGSFDYLLDRSGQP